MKKIFVVIGSRQKNGNTTKFLNKITATLSEDEFHIEYAYPQDYKISPCIGCNECFINAQCSIKDDIVILQEKMLNADILFIASPVYLHYMTADLKLILDRLSWWSHTLRLQGKPIVIISTCSSNGFNSVLEPLSEIVTFMGGNVIATANAAQLPNQINNDEWLNEVSSEIANRVEKFAYLPPQSNPFIEKVFSNSKIVMLQQEELAKGLDIEFGESKYWRRTGMMECDSFREYLEKSQ